MSIIYLLGFILMVIGIAIALKIDIKIVEERIRRYISIDRRKSIYSQINKKPPRIVTAINQIQNILSDTNQEHKFLLTVLFSILLVAVAVVISTMINNIFLLPVLVVFAALIPFIQLKLMYSEYQHITTSELETALSMITITYLSTDSFVSSVKQNIPNIKAPIKVHFENFVWMYENANPSLEACVQHLKMQINNKTFSRWCTTVIKCIDNHMLKHSLTEIINRLVDEKLLLTELRTKIQQVRNEFFSVVLINLSTIPLIYFLNRDWFDVIVDTEVGRIVLAINLGITFFATIRTILICNITSFEHEIHHKKGVSTSA